MIFGKDRDRGIRFQGEHLEVVRLGENGVGPDDVLVHDETRSRPSRAFQLSRMEHPDFPIPIGVFRAVERPTFEAAVQEQMDRTLRSEGPGDLDALLNEGNVWEI
jgi:2-oxoglutarate ferredoxin oxidoreductase subunit beta